MLQSAAAMIIPRKIAVAACDEALQVRTQDDAGHETTNRSHRRSEVDDVAHEGCRGVSRVRPEAVLVVRSAEVPGLQRDGIAGPQPAGRYTADCPFGTTSHGLGVHIDIEANVKDGFRDCLNDRSQLDARHSAAVGPRPRHERSRLST